MKILLAALILVSGPALAQVDPVPPRGVTVVEEKQYSLAPVEAKQEMAGSFRREFLQATRSAARKGDITRAEAIKLRVASFSPAFLEEAKRLCVVQIAFSGEDSPHVPVKDDGAIDVDGIDWEGLAAFLERILPLILQLLAAFGLGL